MASPSVVTHRPIGQSQTPIGVVAGVFGGIALAVVWSARFVDREIGMTVADSVLGGDAREMAIADALSGAAFAFVSGFAGTFTACNIAVFGALPAMAGASAGRLARARATLDAMRWLGAGLVTVAALYGFVAVLIGSSLPQVSTATVGNGMPVRLLQSVVVFTLIGLAFCYLAAVTFGLLRDPFAGRPRMRLVVLGALIGGFLVGRPYPLFNKLLVDAVESHNPWYGSLVLVLQAVGNVLLVTVVALVVTLAVGEAGARWLAKPSRAALIGGTTLLILGTFMVVYWGIRLPARFDYGWFPTMPWNA
jgi:hypothetical protein